MVCFFSVFLLNIECFTCKISETLMCVHGQCDVTMLVFFLQQLNYCCSHHCNIIDQSHFCDIIFIFIYFIFLFNLYLTRKTLLRLKISFSRVFFSGVGAEHDSIMFMFDPSITLTWAKLNFTVFFLCVCVCNYRSFVCRSANIFSTKDKVQLRLKEIKLVLHDFSPKLK